MQIAETTPLPTTGEQCPSCGAGAATDQRYCVECGERLVASRFPGRQPVAIAPPPPPRRRLHASGSTTLIAGIGTLLVAMAVGVLIGRSGATTQPAASNGPVRVVTVPGTTAAAAAATPTPAAAATKAKHPRKAAKKNAAPAKAAPVTKAAPLPTTTPPPTVAVGSPGKGRGYKDGKFTGDFFGP